MRKLVTLIAAALPAAAAVPAWAEQVVLRIEARRAAQSQAVADDWAGRLPGVVTFPLPGGWTGIGIGPMERDAAEAELARLKAAGAIPADSFIAPAPDGVAPAGNSASGQPEAAQTDAAGQDGAGQDGAGQDGAGAAAPVAANPAAAASTFVPPRAAPDPAPEAGAQGGDGDGAAVQKAGDGAEGNRADADAPAAAPAGAEPVAAASGDGASGDGSSGDGAAPAAQLAEGDYLRLQRFETREAADEALARWRADFPETGLTRQADGAYAVTLGPLPADIAAAWLGALRAAERVGKPGAVVPAADLGTVIVPGSAIDLPGPGTAAMPPLDEVQRALRWAGHYDGRIDGKDGPQTRAAIAAEVLALRAAPDAGSAMQALIDRRAAWRAGMGLARLDDPQSGLSVTAPMDRLQFDRNEQGLSIYGPKDGSGAALILYSAPGGQQEMLDFAGLVTALGWVPSPQRRVDPGQASLKGRNATHIGQAEARVVDGRVEGLVLIWPVMDEADQPRIAAELIDSLSRTPAAAPAETGSEAGAATDAAAAAGGDIQGNDAPAGDTAAAGEAAKSGGAVSDAAPGGSAGSSADTDAGGGQGTDPAASNAQGTAPADTAPASDTPGPAAN
ncbi:peptidoglycan-binding domain-containing protein [Paracoccus contaminans]|uniref:Peptidoglycan-binding protein n=1 Tax=Paracoccus contaminans TaxID=1945662 RepID=A0A1W6CVU2_9RHOB|nr:peptidoglycan-binding domain-containing protein [Paracoccus contaminans]ARJ68945.1 hypothetical protein B0A89_04165 [Paracoccus contaminans]